MDTSAVPAVRINALVFYPAFARFAAVEIFQAIGTVILTVDVYARYWFVTTFADVAIERILLEAIITLKATYKIRACDFREIFTVARITTVSSLE